MTHLFKNINRYYLSTYSQNLSFIYNKSVNFAAEIKIMNKKKKNNNGEYDNGNKKRQCKLLKGVGTGKVLRECPLCVADASEFLEEILEKEGIQK